MKGNVLNMPSSHTEFFAARTVLQNLDAHNDVTIDAAFEVLIYSPDPSDKKLCEDAVEHMWGAPKMSRNSIMVVAAFMTVCFITISIMLVDVLL